MQVPNSFNLDTYIFCEWQLRWCLRTPKPPKQGFFTHNFCLPELACGNWWTLVFRSAGQYDDWVFLLLLNMQQKFGMQSFVYSFDWNFEQIIMCTAAPSVGSSWSQCGSNGNWHWHSWWRSWSSILSITSFLVLVSPFWRPREKKHKTGKLCCRCPVLFTFFL
jgi:hypothetical protein